MSATRSEPTYPGLTIRSVGRGQVLGDHEFDRAITDLVVGFSSQLISHPEELKAAFKDYLLDRLVTITNSEYGFVCEVLSDEEGSPYMRVIGHALTDISWDRESSELYAAHYANGLEFRNLNTLFGSALLSGELLIANEVPGDPRSGGLPHGHPPLRAFMALPVWSGTEMVGMLGLANRPGGYEEALAERLTPLQLVCGSAISGVRAERAREAARRAAEASQLVMQQQLEEMRRISAMKDTFVASVSHELRTPLTAVMSFAEALENGAPADVSLLAGGIQRNARRLSALIDDVMLLSAGASHGIMLQYEQTLIARLVEEAVDYCRSVRTDVGLDLDQGSISPEAKLAVDPRRLFQIVNNLVGNALKFSHPGSAVQVRAELTDRDWVLTVIDQGIGIPADEFALVREPFYRATNADFHSVRGTGVGLNVVCTIVEAHSGRLDISSVLNRGTTVTVTIPRER